MSKHTAAYLSTTDSAKLLRAALKANFPKCKFSVRGSKYSGGSSIYISWTDGPTSDRVDAVLATFGGKGFDGSIDMSYTIQAWTLNGEVVGTRCIGTQGSRGDVAPWGLIAPHDDCELIAITSYIQTSRTISANLARRCVDQIATATGCASVPVVFATESGYRMDCPDYGSPMGDHLSWRDLVHQAAGDRAKFAGAL